LEYLNLKMWPNGGHSYVLSELIKHYPNLRSLAISFIDNNWVSACSLIVLVHIYK